MPCSENNIKRVMLSAEITGSWWDYDPSNPDDLVGTMRPPRVVTQDNAPSYVVEQAAALKQQVIDAPSFYCADCGRHFDHWVEVQEHLAA